MATEIQKAPRTDQTQQLREIEKRWSKTLTKAGWTAVPNVVLDKQHVLGLRPIDFNIIAQIAKHWWNADSAPFPSVDRIANAIGVTTRSVQRRITKMEKAGLIERNERYYARGGQKSNAYTFKGLIAKCTPFADEIVTERARRKSGERSRLRRRSPLTVVK